MKVLKVSFIVSEAGLRTVLGPHAKGASQCAASAKPLTFQTCHRPSCRFPAPTGRNCPGALLDREGNFLSLAEQL